LIVEVDVKVSLGPILEFSTFFKLAKTALESPQLAQYNLLSLINITTAVVPEKLISICGFLFIKSDVVFLNASLSASSSEMSNKDAIVGTILLLLVC
jgi:hypothetical protein